MPDFTCDSSQPLIPYVAPEEDQRITDLFFANGTPFYREESRQYLFQYQRTVQYEKEVPCTGSLYEFYNFKCPSIHTASRDTTESEKLKTAKVILDCDDRYIMASNGSEKLFYAPDAGIKMGYVFQIFCE